MRASIGLVGFCLLAFVQQPARASGGKSTQGKFSHQNTFISPGFIFQTLGSSYGYLVQISLPQSAVHCEFVS
jgi:hypothetical protein